MICATQVTYSFHHLKKQRAFSLLELLAVTAILALIAGLLAPALQGLTSPAGRKGAVTIVMNTLEQARVSAIETGRDVVVLFWRKNGSTGTQPDEPDALMLLRRNETDTAWEPATRWIKLPNGVLFHSEDENSLIRGSQPDSSLLLAVPGATPSASQTGALQFSSSGAVKNPATPSAGLYIAFTEGQRASGSNTLAIDKQKSGGREVISLARYTGRATMDIVATP